VTEIADNAAGENTTVHHQSGAVTFTDVDLSDTETGTVSTRQVTGATLANGYTLTAAQQNALLSAFTIDAGTHSQVNGTGTVGWHYDISDGAIDFLGDDDQVTLTFTVQVNDGHGGIITQNVVITVNGTEDVPVVTTTSNSFAELAASPGNPSGTSYPNTDSVSGTINFNDVDLSDRPTVATAFSSYNYTGADGVTALSLTPSQQTAILKALVLGPTPPNTSSGSVTWTYSVADNALDFLAQNETVTLTYNATVNDLHGGIVTKPITVTIHGTNDAPVIKYTGTYTLDQFNTQDYGAWVEAGNNSNGAVNGNPFNTVAGGEFRLAHDPSSTANADAFQIRLTDLDEESDVPDTLTRTYNLVGAGNTAAVDFDYRRNIPDGESNDHFDVLVSINGGAFTALQNSNNNSNNIGTTVDVVDQSYLHFHANLSLPAAQTIQSVAIRFSVGDDVDNGDVVFVDNVKVSYATTPGATQTINYTENSAVGILPPQITDADHNAIVQSATVKLTGFFEATDLLSVTGSLPGGITALNYNPATGELKLTGSASLADYQTALSHVLFSNTSDNPSNADRTLTITVNDGIADSNAATATIHVTPVDDLPFATPDNVITNVLSGNSFQIPKWALLANDQDLDNALTITGGGSDVTTTNSFSYTATGGSLNSTAQVSVTRDNDGTISGGSGDDILIARPSTAVTMNGGSGNDVLIGNTGSQIMNGGPGSDTFVFKALADSTHTNFDTIQDFTPGVDHLDFTTIPSTTNLHQMANATDIAPNSISWFKDGSQTIVYVNTTVTQGNIDMEIHLTGTNINLSGSDILHHT
jgi:VCBS repeat-containing protein